MWSRCFPWHGYELEMCEVDGLIVNEILEFLEASMALILMYLELQVYSV